MCLAQGHNTKTLVRLEPAAPRSRVKHSTTEQLRSLQYVAAGWKKTGFFQQAIYSCHSAAYNML